MSYNYSNVLNPKRFTICGVELKPFSLGHYIVLEQVKSPYLTDDPDASSEFVHGIYTFFLTLVICGHTYEENIILLEDGVLLKKEADRFCKHFLKFSKKNPGWTIYKSIDSFKEYIQYFTEIPTFSVEKKSNTTPSGIDWKQNLFTIAKNEFGYSDAEILNMPLRRLFYEWCSSAEKNGAVKVQNDHDLMLIEIEKKQNRQNVMSQWQADLERKYSESTIN